MGPYSIFLLISSKTKREKTIKKYEKIATSFGICGLGLQYNWQYLLNIFFFL